MGDVQPSDAHQKQVHIFFRSAPCFVCLSRLTTCQDNICAQGHKVCAHTSLIAELHSTAKHKAAQFEVRPFQVQRHENLQRVANDEKKNNGVQMRIVSCTLEGRAGTLSFRSTQGTHLRSAEYLSGIQERLTVRLKSYDPASRGNHLAICFLWCLGCGVDLAPKSKAPRQLMNDDL